MMYVKALDPMIQKIVGLMRRADSQLEKCCNLTVLKTEQFQSFLESTLERNEVKQPKLTILIWKSRHIDFSWKSNNGTLQWSKLLIKPSLSMGTQFYKRTY